jgi:hypothetical protein
VARTDNDPAELVAIAHKSHDGFGRCTREQFEKVWKPKGWRLATKQEVADAKVEPNPGSTPQIGPETPLDGGQDPVAQAPRPR